MVVIGTPAGDVHAGDLLLKFNKSSLPLTTFQRGLLKVSPWVLSSYSVSIVLEVDVVNQRVVEFTLLDVDCDIECVKYNTRETLMRVVLKCDGV